MTDLARMAAEGFVMTDDEVISLGQKTMTLRIALAAAIRDMKTSERIDAAWTALKESAC